MAQTFTISQVAKATGVAAKTIRSYEGIGVLPPPSRTVSGYRQYDEPGVQRVPFIRRGRALGLPLSHLKTLMATLNGRPRSTLRPRLLALVRHQLSAVKRQIAELQLLQRELEPVLQRPLASAHERRAQGGRCLDIESARSRPAASCARCARRARRQGPAAVGLVAAGGPPLHPAQ
jgi:DNA-binding transcriptional MerR regulator